MAEFYTIDGKEYLVHDGRLWAEAEGKIEGGREERGLSRNALKAKLIGKKKSERKCKKCGETGHRKDNCPSR